MSALAATAVAVLAGCGGQQVVPAQATVQAPPARPASSLARLDPCTLLDPGQRSRAGLTSAGDAKPIGAARACDWTEAGRFGVTVTLDGTTGLDQLRVQRRAADPITIGGHRALLVADRKAGDGTCAVLIGAGDGAGASAQIDVSNNSFSDTDLACRRAMTVAAFVEPKLP